MADVYDMSDEDYDKLEQNALVSWRFSYPKFAAEADNDDANPDHETTNHLCPGDARECYTDGYRTAHLLQLDRIRALESELSAANKTTDDLIDKYEPTITKLESELAELRKREEDLSTLLSHRFEWLPRLPDTIGPNLRLPGLFMRFCYPSVAETLSHAASWLRARSPRPEPEHRDDGKSDGAGER